MARAGAVPGELGVAILTAPGGTVLVAAVPVVVSVTVVAILTAPGGTVLAAPWTRLDRQ